MAYSSFDLEKRGDGGGGEQEKFDEYPHKQITETEIDRLGIPWSMLDNVKTMFDRKEKIAIVNLDYTNRPGTHWTLLLTNPGTKMVFFFDPLGYANDGNYNLKDDLFEKQYHVPREIMDAARAHGYPIYVNKRRIQYLKSWMCGYYVLKLAQTLRDSPALFQKATSSPAGFEEVIKRVLGSKPSESNVDKTMKWWGGLCNTSF